MKKKTRRIKRSVRKTLGALFLASSIVVAAIPTGSYAGGQAEAANSCTGVIAPECYILPKGGGTATNETPITEIPKIESSAKIYTTGDQTYYFAYVNSNGYDTQDTDKFAIITGYNASGAVDASGNLVIPSEVMSYRKLSDAKGYCLTNVSGEFLFYRDTVTFTTIEVVVPNTTGAINDFEDQANSKGFSIGNYNNGTSDLYQFLQGYTPSSYRESGYYEELEPFRIGIFSNTPVENYDPDDPTKLLSTTYTYNIENIFYNPCTKATESTWKSRDKATLYYATMNSSGQITSYDVCSDDNHQYADAIPIRYIANQFSEYDPTSGTYKLSSEPIDDEHPNNGIFAGTKGQNIVNIVIPESMEGIGDYAFYGCTALRSITLSNQLVALGNHCFDGCRALNTVNMAENPRLDTIGAYAFANCPALASFYVPHSIKLLCDGVFENDTALTSVDLTGDINSDPTGNGSNLQYIGNHLFYGCGALKNVTMGTALGSGYSLNNKREISINIFEDCPSLERITVLSPYVTFVDDNHNATSSPAYPACKFTLENFHDLLTSDQFYFEGVDPAGARRPNEGIGALHTTCQNMAAGKEFTFKYFGEELYEKTVTEEGGGKAIYQVDNTNTLCGFTTVEDSSHTVKSLSFPEHFGPYYINEIPAEKFLDLKNLETVKLPSTINIIGDRAFKGCCNLQYVYFGNDNVQIGTEAFRTQQVSTGSCPPAQGGDPAKQLYFVTSIGDNSAPFRYAMSQEGMFSHDLQNRSWPIIYSGFPSLLEVKYNPDKDCAELTNFPTASSIQNYKDAWYLSADEKAAIVAYNPSSPSTAYDYALKECCETLRIPGGVKSIEDGLFAKNTSSSNPIAVISEGLTEIDVDAKPNTSYQDLVYGSSSIDVTFNNIVTVDKTKGDFAGCEGLTSFTFQGNENITIPDYAFYGCTNLESVTVSQHVDSIGEQAFSECDKLTKVELAGVGEIKDHAFLGDDLLSDVTISADTTSLGLAPFRLCKNLSNVKFGDNPYFTTSNGIIYGLDSSGNRYSIIEFLAGRSSKTVQTAEVQGINGISQEAFADTDVQIVNLESSSITSVPEYAFDDCDNLVSVYLPDGCELIKSYAFRASSLSNLTVNDSDLDWQSNGLDLIQTTYDFSKSIDHGESEGKNDQLTVFAPAETDENGNVTNTSRTYDRFKNHKYLVEALVPITHYYVTYWDFASADATKRTVRTTEEYVDGDTVTVLDPLRAVSEGFIFNYYENRDDTDETYGYRDKFEIHSDIVLQAVYEGVEEATYTATFMDIDPSTGADGSVLVSGIPVESKVDANGNTVYYVNGALISGISPTKTGYTFKSWSPVDPRNSNEFALTDVNFSSTDSSVIVFRAFYQADNGNGGGGGGNVNPEVKRIAKYYMADGTTLYQQVELRDGDTAPNLAIPTGYTGYEWSPKPSETVMNSDKTFILVPSEGNNNGSATSYTATYYYTDGVTVYQTLTLEAGATPPDLMMPAGYKQCMWSPSPSSVTIDKNIRFTMVSNPNYVDPSPSPSNDPNYTGPYYTLTVVNGSGSGSYKPGAQVIIQANDAKTGQQFSSWTVSPTNVPIASKVMSATVLTMPSENVTVTANFVASTSGNNNNGSNGSGSGGNGGNNGNTNYWPSTGNVARSSGTTVVIEKNGLSNTGVVSATVNGSTDNFTIKITQSQTAERQILDALLKKYGTVDNLIYFPMDISLYDAAGTTQIHDTSGLTITITLPLPDSMIQYAANNKVAVVTNGEIDGLNARFTTINGVPCVTFTCTHFSPYVIYVNTVELTSGSDGSGGYGTGNLDNTPKTADFIHPKWFVSIALFAISIVLFLMKDKRNLKPVKANNGNNRKVTKR
ncbi:MAG: leucine-rich repeat protein [Lachnospiraceae bacterium]|nr:leucine-rich repeat protein [Lachnospiraceae bacterium]